MYPEEFPFESREHYISLLTTNTFIQFIRPNCFNSIKITAPATLNAAFVGLGFGQDALNLLAGPVKESILTSFAQ
jgi:hypothetical protein